MKNLAKILGASLLGVASCNLNAQEKSFVKEDYDKYCLTYAIADINDDGIPEVVVVDYDLNGNNKKDVRGLFIITGKEELPNGDMIYRTRKKACMLVFDIDEDGKDDEVLIDTNLDGILDYSKSVKNIKKSSGILL